MKPVEMPPMRQVLKPEPQPVYPCPKCGRAMTKGVVRVWQEVLAGANDLGEVIVATVGSVLVKAGSGLSGAEPQLQFIGADGEPLQVVRSGCVQTSYRCDCGVVAIFPVFPSVASAEARES